MKRYPNWVFIVFFLSAVAILHHKSWDKLPTGVHAWAQSDHYNLALGYLHNGFDFFHPQTYSLSHQFPPKERLVDPQGITAVDFPLYHYVAALSMFALGDTSPWIFRLVTLLWSLVALWFLFETVRRLKGIAMAILVCGFIMFQPFYCYYQNGFHVSSAAFNTFLIGLTLLIKHFKTARYSFYIWGVSLLTLAALMRFTHMIGLLALGGMCVVVSMKYHRWDRRIWPVALGVLCVFGYFLYNQYLAQKYGSVFLNHPIVSDSFGEFLQQLLGIGTSYIKGFIPPFHLFLLVLLLYYYLKHEARTLISFNEMIVWICFLCLGAVAFTILMTWSLSAHDYYSLDVWMPVLSSALLFLVLNVPDVAISSTRWKMAGYSFLIVAFSFSVFTQERRYGKNVRDSEVDVIISNFQNSQSFLNSIIPSEAKVLVICSGGWNSPMVGWPRKVYRVAWKFSETIPDELKLDYDFIVTHDLSFQQTVLNNDPDFMKRVDRVSGNGLVTIWEKRTD